MNQRDAKSHRKQDRIDKALGTLYELYYAKGPESEPARLALKELMEAYDDWLD